jgi:hypothetical protein
MGILADGVALVENLIPAGLITAASKIAEAPRGLRDVASSLVEAIAINSVWKEKRGGKTLVVKRRNLHSGQLADLTNLYFSVANIPIRFWSKLEQWRRWEVDCFEMLNGDCFHAYKSGLRSVIAEKLPGDSLWGHLNRGTLTRQMLRAAAAEFRRAHQFWSDEFRGPWSHGDASVTNVIYDATTNRARLIDFEIHHGRSLSAAARQADDLLVFLLDLVGSVPSRQWLALATTFLEAYGDKAVISHLRPQLDLPGRLAWIWWGVRTNFTNAAQVKHRLANLSRAIPNLKLQEGGDALRDRSKRRPSTNCQVMRPGIPIPSSRRRMIRERANALSPGMPRRLPTKT